MIFVPASSLIILPAIEEKFRPSRSPFLVLHRGPVPHCPSYPTGLCWWLRCKKKKKKNFLQCRKTRVPSLGWEDPLEKDLATHSSMLAWRIPGTEEPGRLQSLGSQRAGHSWRLTLSPPSSRGVRVISHGHACMFLGSFV